VKDAITDIENVRLVARDEFAVRFGLAATGTQDQVAV